MTTAIEVARSFTAANALNLISTATFRDFTHHDWMAYCGCEAEFPRIAEGYCMLGVEYVIIVADSIVEIYFLDGSQSDTTDEAVVQFNLSAGVK